MFSSLFAFNLRKENATVQYNATISKTYDELNYSPLLLAITVTLCLLCLVLMVLLVIILCQEDLVEEVYDDEEGGFVGVNDDDVVVAVEDDDGVDGCEEGSSVVDADRGVVEVDVVLAVRVCDAVEK